LFGLLKKACYKVSENQEKKIKKRFKGHVMTETAENLYRTWEKRVADAIELKASSRVPVTANFAFFPAPVQRKRT
jgi:ribosomal protein S3AE